MGYSVHDCMVEVVLFKSSGKWCRSEAINMNTVYYTPSVQDAVLSCWTDQVGNLHSDWMLVCLEPYHQHAHPVLIKGT